MSIIGPYFPTKSLVYDLFSILFLFFSNIDESYNECYPLTLWYPFFFSLYPTNNICS